MKYSLNIIDNLPFVKIKVIHSDKKLILKNVLIDTGSAKTILKEELVEQIDIKPEPDDILGSIRGIGGTEFVYIKEIDFIAVENIKVKKI